MTKRGRAHVVIAGPIAPADVPRLWDSVRASLRGDPGVVACDVTALGDPDAGTVDALARLQLAARRSGWRIRLHHACVALQSLLLLMGLAEVLPCAPDLPEVGRQAEHREPPLGVEEEADPGDPIA
jgi:ABC-type transporter Mla MlaB component